MLDDHKVNCGVSTCEEDRDALLSLIRPLGETPTVIEVGTWSGTTARFLAMNGCKVYTVDHWHGSEGDLCERLVTELGRDKVIAQFLANTEPWLMRSIIPLIGESGFIAGLWPKDFRVDAVWIDGDHTLDGCRRDIKAWAPKVRPGGIVCGHDHDHNFPGVQQAVADFGYDGIVGRTVWYRRM